MEYSSPTITFAITLVNGAILCLLFDFYQIGRRTLRLRAGLTMAGDILYWLVATIIVYGGLLVGNWGELRLYVWLALGCGALAYHRFFRTRAVGAIVRLLQVIGIIKRGLVWLEVYFILWPLRLLLGLVIRPIKFIINYFWFLVYRKRNP
mgnify:CR=1 FL=1